MTTVIKLAPKVTTRCPTSTPVSRWTCVSPSPPWRSSPKASASPAICAVPYRVGTPPWRPIWRRPTSRWPAGTLSACLYWAATIGLQTLAAIEHVLQARTHPQQGYRTALGILRLAKGYDPARLEAACRRAIQINAVTYRTIASILKHGLEHQVPTPAQATLPADHANVRGSAYYH